MQTLQNTNKRTTHLISIRTRTGKIKKVGDVLKNLGLDQIGTGKSDLSMSHDNLLYK